MGWVRSTLSEQSFFSSDPSGACSETRGRCLPPRRVCPPAYVLAARESAVRRVCPDPMRARASPLRAGGGSRGGVLAGVRLSRGPARERAPPVVRAPRSRSAGAWRARCGGGCWGSVVWRTSRSRPVPPLTLPSPSPPLLPPPPPRGALRPLPSRVAGRWRRRRCAGAGVGPGSPSRPSRRAPRRSGARPPEEGGRTRVGFSRARPPRRSASPACGRRRSRAWESPSTGLADAGVLSPGEVTPPVGGCSSDPAGLRLRASQAMAGPPSWGAVGSRLVSLAAPGRVLRGSLPVRFPVRGGLPSALAVADPRRAPGRPVAVRRSVTPAGAEPRPARRGRGPGLDEVVAVGPSPTACPGRSVPGRGLARGTADAPRGRRR